MESKQARQKALKFWELKHAIDDEVATLGWSTTACRNVINKRYRKRSRLLLSDEQLEDLLAYLQGLNAGVDRQKAIEKKEKRKKRRHK
ncbi:hypothetical protein [Pleurocapsa sp. FMAR1]|uniref:hypothetical protein n=1 Tax=Pleurocapsa sp. FMAR1 TaxID=3040204 RepID=UPI0029C94248|nr:hypothetical protein [Pleurocapsa sp. FMAR1]